MSYLNKIYEINKVIKLFKILINNNSNLFNAYLNENFKIRNYFISHLNKNKK